MSRYCCVTFLKACFKILHVYRKIIVFFPSQTKMGNSTFLRTYFVTHELSMNTAGQDGITEMFFSDPTLIIKQADH